MECHSFFKCFRIFFGVYAAALFEKTGLFFCGDSETDFNDFNDQMNFMEE